MNGDYSATLSSTKPVPSSPNLDISEDWVLATVPGTVLASYLNIGAIPDPNYGDNQLLISDSFFYADFWYRTEFATPSVREGERLWLNFDGINWKAEVFLNGEQLGQIDGGFMRARFDVTKRLVWQRAECNRRTGHKKRHTWQREAENLSKPRNEWRCAWP